MDIHQIVNHRPQFLILLLHLFHPLLDLELLQLFREHLLINLIHLPIILHIGRLRPLGMNLTCLESQGLVQILEHLGRLRDRSRVFIKTGGLYHLGMLHRTGRVYLIQTQYVIATMSGFEPSVRT